MDLGERGAGRGGLPLAEAIPFAVLLAVVLTFFFPFWGEGKIFLAADALYDVYPWRGLPRPDFPPHGPAVFDDHPIFRNRVAGPSQAHNPLITDPLLHNWTGGYNREMKEGWPSRWQPLILAGLPASEIAGQTGSPGRYYPPKMILHRLLPPHLALMFLLMAHMLLMGWAMHRYLREVGAEVEGALLGAAAYMLNGSVMVWLGHEVVVAAGAFLPLILLAQERWLGPRRWLWTFLAALFLGFATLASQLQYVLYIALLMILYQCFILARAWRGNSGWRGLAKLLGCFSVASLGGAMIAAVQLLPTLDLVENSARIERVFSFQGLFDTLARVPFRYFATMAFPYFFGGPPLRFNPLPRSPLQEYMNFNELCFYMGIPAIFLFLAALVLAKRGATRFHLLLAVTVGAMMTGTWAYYPLFRFFPGMDRMNPTRITFLFVFAFSAAAGLGWSALGPQRGRRRAIVLAAIGALLAVILSLGLLGGTEGVSRWFNAEVAAGKNPSASGILEMLRHLRRPSSPVILPQMILACLAAALIALRLFAVRAWARRSLFILLLGLLGFEMISFGWGYGSFTDRKQIFASTPAIDFLRGQPGPFRVVQDTAGGFYSNTLAPFGIEEIGGYSSFSTGRARSYLSVAEFGDLARMGRRFDRWVHFTRGSPLLDLANVRYLLTTRPVSPESQGLRPAFDGEVAIYEIQSAMPRAFVVHRAVVRKDAAALDYVNSPVFDMRGEVVLEEEPARGFLSETALPSGSSGAEIARFSPDRVEINATLSTNGYLVLSDAWYPGWVATVDGSEAVIERANYLFRGVALRAGEHRVVFTYRPLGLRIGLFVTLGGVAVILAGIAFFFRKRGRGERWRA